MSNYKSISYENSLGSISLLKSIGSESVTGSGSGLGYAEFVQTTQGSNISVQVGDGISYLLDNPNGVYNTISGLQASGTTTMFYLPNGTYIINYENSSSAPITQAIYQGTRGSLSALNSTISSSSVASTWIHGSSIIQTNGSNNYVIIGPISGTLTIPVISSLSVARVTFLKIA
jgi:hypothetical protein